MKRLHLPAFIEVFMPTRDRAGKALSATKLRHWKDRLTRYLLEDLKVTGFQESKREGVWKKTQRDIREYDPGSDRVVVVREQVQVLRTSCTNAQLEAFKRRGEAVLVEMGKALDQEAVAYETQDGLVILFLS
jgi:hypothetical protein